MFKLRQDDYEVQTRRILLDNTLTVKIGDLIVPLNDSSAATNATGNVIAGGSGFPIGLVVGFCGPQGQVISTGTSPANTPGQLVTTSTNTSPVGNMYQAMYIPLSIDMEFSATLSNTAATTAGSGSPFVFFNLSDCRTVDETSVVTWGAPTAPLQILSLGLDPEDTSNKTIICRILSSGLTSHQAQ